MGRDSAWRRVVALQNITILVLLETLDYLVISHLIKGHHSFVQSVGYIDSRYLLR